jgi:hypothetical protein
MAAAPKYGVNTAVEQWEALAVRVRRLTRQVTELRRALDKRDKEWAAEEKEWNKQHPKG